MAKLEGAQPRVLTLTGYPFVCYEVSSLSEKPTQYYSFRRRETVTFRGGKEAISGAYTYGNVGYTAFVVGDSLVRFTGCMFSWDLLDQVKEKRYISAILGDGRFAAVEDDNHFWVQSSTSFFEKRDPSFSASMYYRATIMSYLLEGHNFLNQTAQGYRYVAGLYTMFSDEVWPMLQEQLTKALRKERTYSNLIDRYTKSRLETIIPHIPSPRKERMQEYYSIAFEPNEVLPF